MSTRVPQFEHSLRLRVLAQLYESPALLAERVEIQRAQRPNLLIWVPIIAFVAFGAVIGLFVLPLSWMQSVQQSQGINAVLELQSLGSLVAIVGLAAMLVSLIQQSQLISVASHLPMSEMLLVRESWFQIVLASLLVLYFNLLTFGSIAYWSSFGVWSWGLALTFAVGHWLLSLSAVSLAVTYVKRTFVLAIALACLIPASLIYCLNAVASGATVSFWDSTVIWATFVASPPGWLNCCFSWGFVEGMPVAYWALLPCCLLAVWGRVMFRRLHESFQIKAFCIRPGRETESIFVSRNRPFTSTTVNTLIEKWNRIFRRSISESPTMIPIEIAVDRIRNRTFLHKQDWTKWGWIERLVDRCLTPRERVVVEFLTAQNPQWTYMWRFLIYFLAALYLFDLLVGSRDKNGTVQLWLFVGGIVSIIGIWPALQARNCGRTYCTQLSSFPIGLNEVFRAAAKVQLVTLAAMLPVVVLLSLLTTLSQPSWPTGALVFSLHYFCILLTGSSWSVIAQYSWGTAFPNQGLKNALWIALELCLVGGLVMGLAMGMTFWKLPHSDWWSYWMFMGLLVISTIGNWLRFQVLYHRGGIDLVRLAPPLLIQSNQP